jgi:hypothetical protein
MTKKKRVNRMSGNYEIMMLHIVHTADFRCLSLRFTIFDYVTKKYIYSDFFDKIKYLSEFDARILKNHAEEALAEIPFEKAPFREHIKCLQNIINSNRVIYKEEPK